MEGKREMLGSFYKGSLLLCFTCNLVFKSYEIHMTYIPPKKKKKRNQEDGNLLATDSSKLKKNNK